MSECLSVVQGTSTRTWTHKRKEDVDKFEIEEKVVIFKQVIISGTGNLHIHDVTLAYSVKSVLLDFSPLGAIEGGDA